MDTYFAFLNEGHKPLYDKRLKDAAQYIFRTVLHNLEHEELELKVFSIEGNYKHGYMIPVLDGTDHERKKYGIKVPAYVLLYPYGDGDGRAAYHQKDGIIYIHMTAPKHFFFGSGVQSRILFFLQKNMFSYVGDISHELTHEKQERTNPKYWDIHKKEREKEEKLDYDEKGNILNIRGYKEGKLEFEAYLSGMFSTINLVVKQNMAIARTMKNKEYAKFKISTMLHFTFDVANIIGLLEMYKTHKESQKFTLSRDDYRRYKAIVVNFHAKFIKPLADRYPDKLEYPISEITAPDHEKAEEMRKNERIGVREIERF